MDTLSIINLAVACLCAFMTGVNLQAQRYNWAIIDAFLMILNFTVAWL